PDTGAPVEDGTLYQFYTRSTGSTMECSMALVTSKCFGVEAVFKEPGGQVINQNTFANRYLSCNASPPPASNFEPHTSLTTLPPGMAKDLGEYRCSGPESAFMCTRITDFSGFTYDKKRHQFLMFGGGHATTFTDALMSLDMRASSPLTWKELYPPTPCSSMTIDDMDHNLGAWKSGPLGPYPRPYSRHTYDKLQVVGDEFIMLMTGTLRGGCAPSDFELFKTE